MCAQNSDDSSLREPIANPYPLLRYAYGALRVPKRSFSELKYRVEERERRREEIKVLNLTSSRKISVKNSTRETPTRETVERQGGMRERKVEKGEEGRERRRR